MNQLYVLNDVLTVWLQYNIQTEMVDSVLEVLNQDDIELCRYLRKTKTNSIIPFNMNPGYVRISCSDNPLINRSERCVNHNIDEFVDNITKRMLKCTIAPLHQTIFSKSFHSIDTCQYYHSSCIKISNISNIQHGIILPPLFVQSTQTIVFKLKHMILICFDTGPIIPVIKRDKIKHYIGYIQTLYQFGETCRIDSSTYDILQQYFKP